MSILKQTLDGKLVSQDPNDESVTILLEKIKTKKLELLNIIPKSRRQLKKR
ncbi:MAG: hypothetical protein J4F36_13925 [Nitrosopumilaceae archaeon]|nr:hypothetical protein [Nitrosopumilaceae archaeon]